VIGGFAALIFGAMKSSVAYSGALERARAAPAVIDALGTPIEDRFYLTGNINVSGPSGKAELEIPVHGPKGDASIYVLATKTLGEWHFEHLIVEIGKTGRRIDLSEKTNTPSHSPDRVPATVVPAAGPPREP
jgi:hypothetical protein